MINRNLPSILDGVDSLIEELFEIRVCRLARDLPKRKLRCLVRSPGPGINLPEAIEQMYRRIESNWGRAAPNGKGENWRWARQETISERNNGPEIRFARAVANFADNTWANHIPTASGLSLIGGSFSRERSRAVDLGHLDGSRHELIELKLGQKCQSAVFAAFEIMISGLLYIFSHHHSQAYKYDPTRQYIRSSVIELIALCPPHCYAAGNFQWLKDDINHGIHLVTRYAASELSMRFAFQELPTFSWGDQEHRDLIEYRRTQDPKLRNRLKSKVDTALRGRSYV